MTMGQEILNSIARFKWQPIAFQVGCEDGFRSDYLGNRKKERTSMNKRCKKRTKIRKWGIEYDLMEKRCKRGKINKAEYENEKMNRE
jgi:hypothetical protein